MNTLRDTAALRTAHQKAGADAPFPGYNPKEISIIGGHILYVPARDGRPAQQFYIKKFDFEGVGSKTVSKLTGSEILGILNMSKAVLDQISSSVHSGQRKRGRLTELRIDFDTRSRAAQVTRKIGKTLEAPTKLKLRNLDVYNRVIPIFKQSMKRPPLELDHLVVDESMPKLEYGLHATPEARKAALDKAPIVHKFEEEDKLYGIESVDEQIRPTSAEAGEGLSTLEHALRTTEATLNHLKQKKEELGTYLSNYIQRGAIRGSIDNLTKRIDRISADIVYCEKKLKQVQSYISSNKGWLDSEYWRSAIRELNDFDSAVQAYISAPINMRYHFFTRPDGRTVGMMRLGIISDMRNGWYSLQDLKDMQGASALKRDEIIAKRIGVLAKDLNKVLGFFDSVKKNDDESSLAYAARLLDVIQEKLNGLGKFPDLKEIDKVKLPLQSIRYGLKRLIEIGTNPSYLEAAIEDRRRVLSEQMLQLVAAQVIRHPECIREGIFKMAHVAFLNQKKHEMANGWMHDEAVEMSDMAAIFEEFNNKRIEFKEGLRGPYIDSDTGVIYLPSENVSRNLVRSIWEEGITLNTYFLNFCVQGDTENKDIQRKINQAGLSKLMRDHDAKRFPELHNTFLETQKELIARDPNPAKNRAFYPELGRLEKIPKKQKSEYRVAEDVLVQLADQEQQGNPLIAVSGGCLSAKDRTGIECARFVQRFLEKSAKSEFVRRHRNADAEVRKIHEERLNDTLESFGSAILDPEMPAARVVFKNTGVKGLKVDPRRYADVGVGWGTRYVSTGLRYLAKGSAGVAAEARKKKWKASQALHIKEQHRS